MTNKKPNAKKTPTKPKAKKPVAKKVVKKQSTTNPNTETVNIQIVAHEAGHVQAPVATGGPVTTKKKKSLWRRILGFGF